jgi:hypothetical protein
MAIKEILNAIDLAINQLNENGYVTEADEFAAVKDIEIAVHKARKVFERTKDITSSERKADG